MPAREEMRTLAQDIVGSFEGRAESLRGIRREVATQMKDLGVHRQALARELRAHLTKERSDRSGDMARGLRDLASARQAMTKELRARLAKARSDLAGSVAHDVRDFASARQAMTKELRARLAKARSDRSADVNRGLRGLASAHAAIHREWQDLTATMAAKRGSATFTPRASVGEPAAGAETSEFDRLGEHLFTYLAKHPDGARLTEMELQFNMNRFEAGRVMRHLMEVGKAEKRGLFYFAI